MINKIILDRIDQYCQEKNAKERRRTHLGASVIGEECERKLWYGFRWAKEEKFTGRMLRLFSRGHIEEFRFVEYLRGIGFTVEEFDENGKQWRISDVMGHFGGSCDGKSFLPPDIASYIANLDPSEPILLEFKTISDKYAKSLKTFGAKVEKPQHWAQMCVYGYKMNLRYALYMSVNKNNDDLHIELLKLDWEHGKQMIELAKGIITNPEPPMRRFPKQHWKCKFCNYNEVCHQNAPMEKNCRSCRFSQPIENAEWVCNAHNSVIPKEFIEAGCGDWQQLSNV